MNTADLHGEPLRSVPVFQVAQSWRELTSALATLGAVAMSLALTVCQVGMDDRAFDRFISSNTLAAPVRRWFIVAALASMLAAQVSAGLYLFFRRQAGVKRLSSFAAVFSPLILAFTLPSLLAHRVWFDRPLQHLVQLLVVVLIFERLMRRALAALPGGLGPDAIASRLPERVRRWSALLLVVISAAAYAAFAGYYTVLEHWRFGTSGYDLGIYDNLMANLLAGKPFRAPVCTVDKSFLSNHAEFGIFFMAPVYALFPRAETLLVIQAIFLGFAALPLYLFAAHVLSRATAVAISIAYLLHAPMHGANFFDFHWMPMAIPLWFLLFYGLVRRKLALVIPTVCLVLPLREETGVMLTTLGAFLILSKYWPRVGAVFCILGPLWFGVLKFMIMPAAGTWWFVSMYDRLIAPGESGYGSVIKTLLVNPTYVWTTLATESKLVYALHLFAPLAILPLRRPLLALLASTGSLFTLLTTDYDATLSIRFQYTSHWTPWLFAASIVMLKVLSDGGHGKSLAVVPIERVGRLRRQAAVSALLLGVFCHSYIYGAILQHKHFVGGFKKVAFGITPAEKKRYAAFRQLAAKIPPEASVAASEALAPHISNRANAYTLKIAHGDAEYLLINGSDTGTDRHHMTDAFTRHPYGLLESVESFYLFKREHESPQTADALSRLGIATP